jgi:hypothetical protein
MVVGKNGSGSGGGSIPPDRGEPLNVASFGSGTISRLRSTDALATAPVA